MLNFWTKQHRKLAVLLLHVLTCLSVVTHCCGHHYAQQLLFLNIVEQLQVPN